MYRKELKYSTKFSPAKLTSWMRLTGQPSTSHRGPFFPGLPSEGELQRQSLALHTSESVPVDPLSIGLQHENIADVGGVGGHGCL